MAFLYQSLNLAKRPFVQKNLRMGEASVFSFSNFGGAYIARWHPVGRDRKPVSIRLLGSGRRGLWGAPEALRGPSDAMDHCPVIGAAVSARAFSGTGKSIARGPWDYKGTDLPAHSRRYFWACCRLQSRAATSRFPSKAPHHDQRKRR